MSLAIFDLTVQCVATALHGYRGAGQHAVNWPAVDDAGGELASGVYLCRLLSAHGVETRKLVLLR